MPEQEKTNSKSSVSLDELFKVAEAEGATTTASPATQVVRPTADPTVAHNNGAAVTSGTGATTSSGDPVLAVQTNNKPKPCGHSDSDPELNKTCPICLWPFCPECASIPDPMYCHLCIPVQDAELIPHPLVDVDGVTHEGRLLTPGPVFGTTAKRISEMSMYELEQHVERYKGLIKQAETALDFRRVTLAMGQMELAQRQDQQRRKLRGIKVPRSAKVISVQDPSKPKPKGGASMANLAKMLEMLQKMQALKKVQATRKDVPNAATSPTEPKV